MSVFGEVKVGLWAMVKVDAEVRMKMTESETVK